MSETQQAASGGIGFVGALLLLFIGLRLGGVIDWSWWWVLSPLWIPLAVAVVVMLIAFVIDLAVNSWMNWRGK